MKLYMYKKEQIWNAMNEVNVFPIKLPINFFYYSASIVFISCNFWFHESTKNNVIWYGTTLKMQFN